MTENSKKILIVDEELGIRESLSLILSDFYDLIITDSDEQALEVINNTNNIGLVLTDIKMVQVKNPGFLDSIKVKQPELNIVIITDNRTADTDCDASSLGACGYLNKPFQSDKVLDLVDNFFTK